jgi:RNase P/RNase MRP subunit POP5
MVVKEKRGRRRYVAFETTDPSDADTVSREIIASAVRSGVRPPKLIQFEANRGIVRSSEPEKEATIRILNAADLPMRTLRTSGTLKTLRERYFSAGPGDGSERKGGRRAGR